MPDFYQAHRLLGVIYQKLERYRDAESEYRTAADLKHFGRTANQPREPFVRKLKRVRAREVRLFEGFFQRGARQPERGNKAEVRRPVCVRPARFTYYKSAFYEDAEDNLKKAIRPG